MYQEKEERERSTSFFHFQGNQRFHAANFKGEEAIFKA